MMNDTPHNRIAALFGRGTFPLCPQTARRYLPAAEPSLRRAASRRGATLLVTLGVLTVISVMIVTFLLTMRYQRRSAQHYRDKTVARQALDIALARAMQFADSAMVASNFAETATQPLQPGKEGSRRVSPVNAWFQSGYQPELPDRRITDKVAFQATDVLLVPVMEDESESLFRTNSLTVNLLTEEVCRLLPAAFTNRLANQPFLRSGWIDLNTDARVSFAVLNCSGFVDANTFLTGPTNHRPALVCYSQPDVAAWLTALSAKAGASARLEPLADFLSPDDSPFSALSYDTDPDIYPLHYDCFEASPMLGKNAFCAYPTVNLNLAHAYKAMGALKEQATYWKFNLNSLTNHLMSGIYSTESLTPWFNGAQFRAEWLDPVVFLLNAMRNEELDTSTLYRWPDSFAIAWNLANFMDADRIPQVSDFPTEGTTETELATRSDYAVEDVPLINKVSIFSIFDPEHPGDKNPDAPKDPSYYFSGNTSNLSNHYAVAVELWYPFAPNLPTNGTACYVGIYTNSDDVLTTTNRPWTEGELRDWFNWNDIDKSNSVMRTLFYAWARAYTNQVGPAVANHPLWQVVTYEGDLWFTPAMTNHPSWPVADTNGVFSITNTPIWQAFYPETYDVVITNHYEEIGTNGTGVVSTNLIEIISTNVYTYVNATNTYVEWVSEEGQTNRLQGVVGTFGTPPYPALLWSNLTSSALSTNVSDYFVDQNGAKVNFVEAGSTNRVLAFTAGAEAITIVVSNEVSGAVTTNQTTQVDLAPWSMGEFTFSLVTNFTFTTEVAAVQPLPMPEDLGLALAALFAILPTNSIPELYTFLMLTPADFTDDMWRALLVYFNEHPSVLDRLMPSHQAPTLGNMTPEDRHLIWPELGDDEAIEIDPNRSPKIQASTFQGYYWTIYPKKTVCFREVEEIKPPEGSTGLPADYQASTNYYALGDFMNGRRNTIWLRPVVTVSLNGTGSKAEEGETETDVIVDEALLTHQADSDVPVWGWTAVTNLYIPDPRKNAYASSWRGFPTNARWLDEHIYNTTNLSTGVSELPFIHFDAPLTSIGDIGHVYAGYQQRVQSTDDSGADTAQPAAKHYDTITFSTRSGAALLDAFTLSPTNGPRRGLVQANTTYSPVLKTLLADVKVGWTNNAVGGYAIADGQKSLFKSPSALGRWADVYADANTNSPLNIGWRSFADMLPQLSTNRLLRQMDVWSGVAGLHPLHDYTEDLLRGVVDKVSFRQNIFVVVVAAQTVSPASTSQSPVVLADQRAAVTVLRDAYSGRWMIYNWIWLTE